MNRIIRDQYPLFREYQVLRNQLMKLLTDADLRYTPGGDNPTFGALCREIGDTQQAYIASFRSWELTFGPSSSDPLLERSVPQLVAWFDQLDQQLEQTISSLSDADIATKVIDRGGDFMLPPHIQLEIYKEALLIFYGKASVYAKALGKRLPEQWQAWIA